MGNPVFDNLKKSAFTSRASFLTLMAFSDHFSSASFLGVPFCRLDSRFTIGGLNGSIVLIPNAGEER